MTEEKWPRLDPMTERWLCKPCWNGIHSIIKKHWDDKRKKYVKTKKSACCGEAEDDHQPRLIGDEKPCPGYERDERIPEWHGFHAARRGLGSNLCRLGVPSIMIQKILRHSNVSVTESSYIKSTSADAVAAMQKFEQSFQATHRPVESNSQQAPGFVN